MPWIRLDDGFPDHPEIALLPVKARWVFVKGLCYASRFLTDGLVPVAIADAWEGRAATRSLVEAGHWVLEDPNYLIVRYLKWNPSKASIEEKRRADSERKRKRNPDGSTQESLYGMYMGGSGVEGGSGGEGPSFEDFYAVFPLHLARGAAERAWTSAIRRAPVETIIAGAQRYRDDPNRDDAYTARPATWLNQDRWEDQPLPPRGNGRTRGGGAAKLMARLAAEREALGG